MNKKIVTTAAACLLVPFALASAASMTAQQKVGYAMGWSTGHAFKSRSINVNTATFSQGLKDAVSGDKSQMTQAQIKQVLTQFQQQQMAKVRVVQQKLAAVNLKAGTAFLATNKAKPGVITLKSGLQYKVIKKGDVTVHAAKVTATDTVTVNYEGKLISGKVFDSSFKRKTPVTFPVKGVIKGWQQALTMMPVGATWKIFVPAKLAYGQMGMPGSPIGPNETLIFTVHLIKVKR